MTRPKGRSEFCFPESKKIFEKNRLPHAHRLAHKFEAV